MSNFTISLSDSIQSFFSEGLIKKASINLNEKESNVLDVINVGIPSVLRGIISKVKTDNGKSIFNISQQILEVKILDNLKDIFNLGNSATVKSSNNPDWLLLIFGQKTNAFVQEISTFTSSKLTSTYTILETVASVCLSFIGRNVTDNHFSQSDLFTWLRSQKEEIKSLLPLGLNIVGLLPGHVLHSKTVKKNDSKWHYLFWFFFVLLFIFLFYNYNNSTETEVEIIYIPSDSVPEYPEDIFHLN